ncbi:hypothetical protein FGE12_18350 [Aggregicoccus sp. 17bor-14]|uniref:hypothetical protein n=1 Tax=Myxococcaceae TaxID=31 RepID=UPI00129CEFBF|nr:MULTISPECIES: hypothetical protein [Myxococcaceae]MBF5044366.1 hypothetical protein [Simulacricoccus sp. 17bor-14]MRI90113.1 hypothetical protein [Aggregicoccus sp. 17bor-14]
MAVDPARHIAPLSINDTTPRQTPDDSFGTTLARTAQAVGRTGGDLVNGLIGTHIGLTAAGNGVAVATNTVSRLTAGTGSTPGSGLPESGSSWELLQAQTLMNQENQQFSLQYLKLQDDMQRESREQNTLSNIMKVRHDSAKAAINNIR